MTIIDIFSGLFTVKRYLVKMKADEGKMTDIGQGLTEVLDMLVDEIEKCNTFPMHYFNYFC